MQTANLFVKFVENAENKWNDIKKMENRMHNLYGFHTIETKKKEQTNIHTHKLRIYYILKWNTELFTKWWYTHTWYTQIHSVSPHPTHNFSS